MSAPALEIVPLAGALGAEVRGLDLRALAAGRVPDPGIAVDAVRGAFHRHLVLAFPDQRLDPESLVALTARFGTVMRVPFVEHMAAHPDVIAVIKEADETGISVFGGAWHSDFSSLPAPPAATLLYAEQVPTAGGDTLFANGYLAYETLSAGMRCLVSGLGAVHSGRPYGTGFDYDPAKVSRSVRMSRGDPAADAEVVHPVVVRHPETGRSALFVNPIYTVRFDGMTEAESAPLLGFLYAHATRAEFTCRLRWGPGTLAMWDNRCALHYAINDYDGHRRELYRTTIAGARPAAAASG